MKLSVPHHAAGAVLLALHQASVDMYVGQRSGPGWVLEFMRPLSAELEAVATALGATVLKGEPRSL